jgi:hypothetical protein
MLHQYYSKFQACHYIGNVHLIVLQRRCFARRSKVHWIQWKCGTTFQRYLFHSLEQREQQRWRRASSTLQQYCATERHTSFVLQFTARDRRLLSTSGVANGRTRNKNNDKNDNEGNNQRISIKKSELSATNSVNHHTTSIKQNATVGVPVVENAKTSTTTDTLTTTTTTTVAVAATNDPYWMERFIPQSYRPYAYLARLDKPIGTMLLVRRLAFIFFVSAPPSELIRSLFMSIQYYFIILPNSFGLVLGALRWHRHPTCRQPQQVILNYNHS